MSISPAQLARDITRGQFSPLYYFLGDDDFRMREAARFVAERYLPQDAAVSGYSRVDMNEKKFDDLRIELAELPFFGERKLVVVMDPQRLVPKQVDGVLKLLQPPQPDRVVIFVTRASRKPKKSAAFYKRMDAAATVVNFGWLTEREAIARAARELEGRNVRADQGALRELFELTAGDAGRLVSETDKLASFVGAGGVVDSAAVRKICAENPRRTVYELVDIVSAGSTSAALDSLGKLLNAGESPTGILFWLGGHFLNLYLLKAGRELPPQQRWLAGRLKGQARNFSEEDLSFAVSQIADCEALMKGGEAERLAASPREALEDLVRDLCLKRGSRRVGAGA